MVTFARDACKSDHGADRALPHCPAVLTPRARRRPKPYGAAAAGSANGALRTALDVQLRLFAPVLPFVTEEVWSWWREGSVHRAPWPTRDELLAAPEADGAPDGLLDVAADVLSEIRKAKSNAQLPMRAEVARAVVRDSDERLDLLGRVEADVAEAGRVAALEKIAGDGFAVDVEFADS